LTETAQSIDG